MTQLALLKRKINFAGDKQIGHVIICTYIDKENERLEFSLAGVPHTQPSLPRGAPPHSYQEAQTLFGWDIGSPSSRSLCNPSAQAAPEAAGRDCDRLYPRDFPQLTGRSRRPRGLSSWPSHYLSYSPSLPQAGTSWRPGTWPQSRFKFPQALRQ